MSILRLIKILFLLLAGTLVVLALGQGVFRATRGEKSVPVETSPAKSRQHVIDRAGVIPPHDLPRFEQYMGHILRESGIDLRIAFVSGTGGKSIEQFAAEMMDQLQIGGRGQQERGTLLLYDVSGKRLKVEVGYGLEAWFPDAFVSYLVEDHARMHFSSGDLSLGLRLMLRLLQHRIREAVIGNDFDPRVLERMRPLTHQSGGAGVSKAVGLGDGASPRPAAAAVDPRAFPAGDTPADAHSTYLAWLSRWPLSPDVELFTPESRRYIAALPLSPAYAEFILMGEYGKSYRIVEKDDLALLYFTGTPLVSPHFLRRAEGRWQMDIVAEVANSREHVGGEYTWAWSGESDAYTAAFGDRLAMIKGYKRIADGDNRPLRIRGGK
jgi:hypothetical protein